MTAQLQKDGTNVAFLEKLPGGSLFYLKSRVRFATLNQTNHKICDKLDLSQNQQRNIWKPFMDRKLQKV